MWWALCRGGSVRTFEHYDQPGQVLDGVKLLHVLHALLQWPIAKVIPLYFWYAAECIEISFMG